MVSNPAEPQIWARTQPAASLDGLPGEIKTLILYAAPNISALQTLVRSSPSYHDIYVGRRDDILATVLLRDIGLDVLPDAMAVLQARQITYASPKEHKDNVLLMLSAYTAEREHPSHTTCTSLDGQTLAALSRLQCVINRVSYDFCRTTLSVHPTTGERIQRHDDLSANEKRRVYRALYRFELFRALFDWHYHYDSTKPDIRYDFDDMDMTLHFYSIYSIWEVEELACVGDYMFKRLFVILQNNSSELSKLRPEKDFVDIQWREENVRNLVYRGPPFLCRLLDATSIVQQASTLQWKICGHSYRTGCMLIDDLEEDSLDVLYQTEMYEAAEAEQELRFENDTIIDGPNAAWPWSTDYKIHVKYYDRDKHALREWGYVMWDLERLEGWGVLNHNPRHLCYD